MAIFSRFITDPDCVIVTIFFQRIEKAKAEKKLLWAEEDEGKGRKHSEGKKKRSSVRDSSGDREGGGDGTQEKPEELSAPVSFIKKPTMAEPKSPLDRFNDEDLEDAPLGPEPTFEGDEKLMIVNDVVANDSPDLFFFVKVRPTVLNKDNFFTSCLFGNVPGGCLSSLQSLLAFVFTPVFYARDVLPESMTTSFYNLFVKLK